MEPSNGVKISFDNIPVRKLSTLAIGMTVLLNFYEDSLVWSITPIVGSTLSMSPTSGIGRNMTFTFSHLPDSNSQFGNKYIKASLPRFNKAESVLVKVFFDKYATNHPNGGIGMPPNWFYYWSRTPAMMVNGSYCTLDTLDPPICGDTLLGYYRYPRPKYYICHMAAESDSMLCKATRYNGIDLFASVCRHESWHKWDWQSWWVPNMYDTLLDSPDRDLILNSVEASLIPWCDSLLWDTNGNGWSDFEDRAFSAECDTSAYWRWIQGQADSLDWSKPGHQY